jgi:thioredoxin 1
MMTPEKTDKGKPVLVEFSAGWCSSCQTMEPVLEAIKKDWGSSIDFIKIDIDIMPQAVAGFRINSIPAFIFFYQREELWRRAGLLSQKELSLLILETTKQIVRMHRSSEKSGSDTQANH